MWPCPAAAAHCAIAASRPSRCRTAATAAAGGVRRAITRQRERIVTETSSGCEDGAHSRNTVRSAGSSTALSSALDARSVSRSASSITTTCQRPSAGRRADAATTARISSTEIESPSGTTARTSGWVPARTVRQAEHCPQPRSPPVSPPVSPSRSHCRAAANACAATERPDPGGPMNSHAWVIAPGVTARSWVRSAAARAAARSAATVSSCPTRESQTVLVSVLTVSTPSSGQLDVQWSVVGDHWARK